MQNILTLHNPQQARDFYLAGIWQQDTLYTLAKRHARERPAACALRDGNVRLTWRETLAWAESIAESLHAAGLIAGDRVAVWLPSRVETALVLLACSRNGYICAPSLHRDHTVEQVCALLERIQCRALFAMPGYGADAQQHSIFARASAQPAMKRVFAVDAGSTGAGVPIAHGTPFPQRAAHAVMSPVDTNPDKIVYLAFTSGTTGTPKGVMHSDNTLLANGRAMVADWHVDPGTVMLTLSGMSHHIGIVAFEQMLVIGCELVLYDPAFGKSSIDWLLETGATYAMGVPTHAIDLLAAYRERGLASLGALRTFYMAGSVIPREVAEQFMRLGVVPQNVYGMTENGSHQYTLPADTPDTIVATCGRACKGYEVRLWDPESSDTEAEPGAIGEIGGRGGLLMLGYFDDQRATEQSFNADGWFMSGDLGQFDEHGCLRIVGRKKDIIIRGGQNIFPSHIEACALRHPGVLKAAAYPVAHERLGEQVCLAVIAKDGAALRGDEILRHLREAGLSKSSLPEHFVVLPAFPLTASGKVLRRVLVEMTNNGVIVAENLSMPRRAPDQVRTERYADR